MKTKIIKREKYIGYNKIFYLKNNRTKERIYLYLNKKEKLKRIIELKNKKISILKNINSIREKFLSAFVNLVNMKRTFIGEEKTLVFLYKYYLTIEKILIGIVKDRMIDIDMFFITIYKDKDFINFIIECFYKKDNNKKNYKINIFIEEEKWGF